MRVAAIDIGSNSVLLTIAEAGSPQPIPLTIVHDEGRIVGLSKGMLNYGGITPEAEERAAHCLKDYRRAIETFKPEKVVATGTEVFRRARNGETVRAQLSEALGSQIRILSGDEEAEMSFWSCQKEHPQKSVEKIVFDIGGASTELCWGNEKGIRERVSLKVGSVVLSEKFNLHNGGEPSAAQAFITAALKEARWTQSLPKTCGIGVAGTITSLFSIQFKVPKYDRQLIHLKQMMCSDVLRIQNEMLSMPLEARRKIIGLQADRADVFPGGMVIANSICQYFGWQEVTCMDSGIRFGALYEAMNL